MDELVARLRAAGCVFAEDEARILTEAADGDAARLEELVTARVGGLPLEQLVGWAELDGRRWTVTPGVFVPRRRSELLVREAAARAATGAAPRAAGISDTPNAAAAPADVFGTAAARGASSPGRVLLVDLCCGCGALGGAVAARLLATGYDVELHAADIDPTAVACAHDNLKALAEDFSDVPARPHDPAAPQHNAATPRHDSTARQRDPAAPHHDPVTPGHSAEATGRLTPHTYTGDLAEPLPPEVRGRVDVLVANAPYVPTAAIGMMPPEAREHEPHTALDGGDDGLAILRRVIDLAPALLRPGGHLLIETGEAQVSAAVGHLTAAGLTPTVLTDDDLGATALAASLPE